MLHTRALNLNSESANCSVYSIVWLEVDGAAMAVYRCVGHGCVLGRGRVDSHVIWILGVYASLWPLCLTNLCSRPFDAVGK